MKALSISKLFAASMSAAAIFSSPLAAQLRVVATTPDLGSIAAEIGGNRVNVISLAKPTEDNHYVDAKPSHIVTLNRADALIEGGAELELGWLPPLLENSRNAKIGAGAPGRIVASEGIRLLEIPQTFDRAKGDVHALGNPHYIVDPLNAKIIARNIAGHLSQIDPKGAALYNANLASFNSRIDAKLTEWQRTLAPYKGSNIVTYHKDMIYLAARFGLNVVDELEPKPGIAPSPAHLAQVIGKMRSTKAKLILVQPFQNRKTAQTVARQASGVVVDVSQQPGAIGNSKTYFQMMDTLVNTLAAAFKSAR